MNDVDLAVGDPLSELPAGTKGVRAPGGEGEGIQAARSGGLLQFGIAAADDGGRDAFGREGVGEVTQMALDAAEAVGVVVEKSLHFVVPPFGSAGSWVNAGGGGGGGGDVATHIMRTPHFGGRATVRPAVRDWRNRRTW